MTLQLHGAAIHVALGALDDAGRILGERVTARRAVLITDSNVGPLYAERAIAALACPGLPAPIVLRVPAGEQHKTRDSWARLTDEMLAAHCGRDSLVVSLGGGVVGDLAGFVASTFMRGIPFVQIPTTLLAMIDASIGGKTGVDAPAGKNLIGTFHHPLAVLVDPSLLGTLPPAELQSGAAEAIKHGVIADVSYFDRIVSSLPQILSDPTSPDMIELIERSIAIKSDVVLRDERESGIRQVLNFGHTLGHALESTSGYGFRHGEAVAIGMVLESELAERVGVAEPGTARAVRAAVMRAGLPAALPSGVDSAALVAATRSDKKVRAGVVRYALPARVGAMAGAASGWSIPVADDLVFRVLE